MFFFNSSNIDCGYMLEPPGTVLAGNQAHVEAPSIHNVKSRLKVKKYKKTSRATSALDTSVVLESVLI